MSKVENDEEKLIDADPDEIDKDFSKSGKYSMLDSNIFFLGFHNINNINK